MYIFKIQQLIQFKETIPTENYLEFFDDVIWMIFGVGQQIDDSMIKWQVLSVIGVVVGFALNIFIYAQLFMIVGSVYISRFKYYQMMDQLDAYAQKKQIPMHIQTRLRLFFQQRYRSDQFFVDKMSCIFSDSLENEILVNQGQKFMKYFQLLEGISPIVLANMLKKCRKEYFLPNDIVR